MTGAGLYVAIEGGEGAGKSTQARMLAQELHRRGISVVESREPGATALGSELRRLLLQRYGDQPGVRTEALLYAADRAHHVEKIVRPALLAGKIVVQDRSIGSSLAYQSGAGGLDYEAVRNLSVWGSGGIIPHMTVYLDIDPEEGLRRAAERGKTNRFEDKGLKYHKKVRQSFLLQAQAHNWFTVSATGSIEEIHKQVVALVVVEALLFGHDPLQLEKR